MKYTAEVTNKDLFDGLLVVQVRYISEDGSKIIQDSYSTRSSQDDNWLQNNINRKLKELEELEVFVEKIPLGQVSLETPEVVDQVLNSAKEQYKEDLTKFNKMVQIIRQGIITADNSEFVELQQKLKDNFQSDYIDLF
jgi:hypothetical protein